ncbi:MAG: NAD(+)/NADH kinase [Clostridia bacterium]|nr:NAD(+)/NADH kinase [Clostridia bacterium]
MKTAIDPNLTRKGAADAAEKICLTLKRYGAEVVFAPGCEDLAKKTGTEAASDDGFYADCDIVIAVGGDGSIIRTAKFAARYGKPVLGVNAGNVAFMAGLEANELEMLRALETGEYSVDSRMMLTVEIITNGEVVKTVNCLNDAVFARGAGIYLTEIAVDCDGVPVNTFRADGIVFATPTGSTAYCLAAGGPIAEPTLESIIFTPICSYSMSSRCIIFSEKRTLTVRPTSEKRPLFLSADGEDEIPIPFGSCVRISKCERYADFIRIKNDEFWRVLQDKIEK